VRPLVGGGTLPHYNRRIGSTVMSIGLLEMVKIFYFGKTCGWEEYLLGIDLLDFFELSLLKRDSILGMHELGWGLEGGAWRGLFAW